MISYNVTIASFVSATKMSENTCLRSFTHSFPLMQRISEYAYQTGIMSCFLFYHTNSQPLESPLPHFAIGGRVDVQVSRRMVLLHGYRLCSDPGVGSCKIVDVAHQHV